jgi:hypothetical protein
VKNKDTAVVYCQQAIMIVQTIYIKGRSKNFGVLVSIQKCALT